MPGIGENPRKLGKTYSYRHFKLAPLMGVT